MKNVKRICIFLCLILVLGSLFSLTAFAAEPAADSAQDSGKLDMNLKPESFEERLEYALQGTATGMLMVFAVLGMLTLILYGSKYVFYDIPNKKKERARDVDEAARIISAEPIVIDEAPAAQAVPTPVAPAAQDDGELAAVITAAIAAMIESGDYKNEFVGGFRVVSFKRTAKSGAWNKQ
ncbi:MAG: OadG family protein [Clostridia bacterium]|nr:OadG family protein [Clostridia bacterium]